MTILVTFKLEHRLSLCLANFKAVSFFCLFFVSKSNLLDFYPTCSDPRASASSVYLPYPPPPAPPPPQNKSKIQNSKPKKIVLAYVSGKIQSTLPPTWGSDTLKLLAHLSFPS